MPERGFPTDVLAPFGRTKQQQSIDAGNNRLAASLHVYDATACQETIVQSCSVAGTSLCCTRLTHQ